MIILTRTKVNTFQKDFSKATKNANVSRETFVFHEKIVKKSTAAIYIGEYRYNIYQIIPPVFSRKAMVLLSKIIS